MNTAAEKKVDLIATLQSLPKQKTIALAVLLLCVLFTYAGDLLRVSSAWWSNPDYIHGFLVIPFAVYLAWLRKSLRPAELKSTTSAAVAGVLLIVGSVALRGISAFISDPVFGPLSLIPCLLGIALVVGGWKTLSWLWPSILFLAFMVPLPSFMESWGNVVLQNVATKSSTFALQILGVPAASFGNVILLTNAELGVEEACSGLRSTLLFFAVSFGAAFIVHGVPERIAVVLSAVPAAIIANCLRIVATGIVYQYISEKLGQAVFHDLFGFVMLPIAAAIVALVVKTVRFVLIEPQPDAPVFQRQAV